MIKKECIAMILAGGQGSRLGSLTKKIAKPAVPFGGKYRIIDFTLSNCYNSGLDTVGVLTQYKPLALHSYIGIGSSWDLDRKNGGVFALPPYASELGGEWYKGTADAIYQNLTFVDSWNPEYIVVLSGDHIYKMDYSAMLEYHKQKGAAATIAVIEVPWAEANRFGIMNTDEMGKIIEFEEKPKLPKNNLASMGVYIFNWSILRHYLCMDEQVTGSSHDFGKDIIPAMLASAQKLVAYQFEGYWKDVGTLESFYEANMDLLKENTTLDLYDPDWRIYSVNTPRPPQYIASTAKVNKSLIGEGCMVLGEVYNSVLFPDVYIGKNAVIRNSIVITHAQIGENAIIDHAIVGRKVIVESGAVIGVADSNQLTVVPEEAVIKAEIHVSELSEKQQVG